MKVTIQDVINFRKLVEEKRFILEENIVDFTDLSKAKSVRSIRDENPQNKNVDKVTTFIGTLGDKGLLNNYKDGFYTGDLNLEKTPTTSLRNLKSVSGSLNLGGTPITSLGNLESVSGYLNLGRTPLTSLGNLQSVGGNLNLSETPIESLGNLESVGGDLYLKETPIESLGNLESVGGDVFYDEGSKVEELLKDRGLI